MELISELNALRYTLDEGLYARSLGNLAVYAFFQGSEDENDWHIVFSGTRKVERVPTSDATLNIICRICEVEDISPMDAEFYDLRTRCGYEEIRPGWCEFARICLEITVDEIWMDGQVMMFPDNRVLQVFAPFIHNRNFFKTQKSSLP